MCVEDGEVRITGAALGSARQESGGLQLCTNTAHQLADCVLGHLVVLD